MAPVLCRNKKLTKATSNWEVSLSLFVATEAHMKGMLPKTQSTDKFKQLVLSVAVGEQLPEKETLPLHKPRLPLLFAYRCLKGLLPQKMQASDVDKNIVAGLMVGGQTGEGTFKFQSLACSTLGASSSPLATQTPP